MKKHNELNPNPPPPPPKKGCCAANWEVFKKAAFHYWDGIGFFGFAHFKLERLKGPKWAPGWTTKLKDTVSIIQNLILLIGLTTVAIQAFG